MSEHTPTVEIAGQRYRVRRDADTLIVSREGTDRPVETLEVDRLGDDARAALDRADFSDPALSLALEGIARAMADRGA